MAPEELIRAAETLDGHAAEALAHPGSLPPRLVRGPAYQKRNEGDGQAEAGEPEFEWSVHASG